MGIISAIRYMYPHTAKTVKSMTLVISFQDLYTSKQCPVKKHQNKNRGQLVFAGKTVFTFNVTDFRPGPYMPIYVCVRICVFKNTISICTIWSMRTN